MRGRPLNLAGVGWLVSAALGVAIGLVVQLGAGAASWTVIGLALVTTGLAVLMPLWRDAG